MGSKLSLRFKQPNSVRISVHTASNSCAKTRSGIAARRRRASERLCTHRTASSQCTRCRRQRRKRTLRIRSLARLVGTRQEEDTFRERPAWAGRAGTGRQAGRVLQSHSRRSLGELEELVGELVRSKTSLARSLSLRQVLLRCRQLCELAAIRESPPPARRRCSLDSIRRLSKKPAPAFYLLLPLACRLTSIVVAVDAYQIAISKTNFFLHSGGRSNPLACSRPGKKPRRDPTCTYLNLLPPTDEADFGLKFTAGVLPPPPLPPNPFYSSSIYVVVSSAAIALLCDTCCSG